MCIKIAYVNSNYVPSPYVRSDNLLRLIAKLNICIIYIATFPLNKFFLILHCLLFRVCRRNSGSSSHKRKIHENILSFLLTTFYHTGTLYKTYVNQLNQAHLLQYY